MRAMVRGRAVSLVLGGSNRRRERLSRRVLKRKEEVQHDDLNTFEMLFMVLFFLSPCFESVGICSFNSSDSV